MESFASNAADKTRSRFKSTEMHNSLRGTAVKKTKFPK